MADTTTAPPSAPIPSTPATSTAPAVESTPSNPQIQPNNTSNIPPSTTPNNENPPNPTDRTNRGLPYYEKLRRELRDTLQKKRLMDKSMAALEDQIYRFEQSYLEETTAGNIIKGFDTYIKGSATGSSLGASGLGLVSGGGGGGTASRRKAAVTDGDRVFSRSSAGFMRDSPAPSSTQTTPSHAPTPNSTYNGSTGNKNNGDTSSAAGSVKGGPSSSSSSSKNKKKTGNGNKGDEDEDEKPPAKRLKISYGRD
ncbi:histone acetyltransferase subunit NuA4-domain-containing protein [Aspergillus spectabilis]